MRITTAIPKSTQTKSGFPFMADIARFDDIDPEETQEWLESIDSVLRTSGPERAHFLLERLIDHARRSGAYLPYSATRLT